jgi:signal transduction histidine kinase
MIILGIVSSFIPNSYWFGISAAAGFSALPGYYFFMIYRRQVTSRLKLVNRLFNIYLIAIVANMIFTIAVGFYNQWVSVKYFIPQSAIAMFLMLTSLTISLTPFLILPVLGNAEIIVPVEGAPRIRANRLSAVVLYMMLVLFLISMIFIWLHSVLSPAWLLLAEACAATLVTAVALAGFVPFEHFFQQVILGMRIHPNRLVKVYSERILTSRDSTTLRHLITADLLPSLLVRQSVLIRQKPGGQFYPFLSVGVTPEQIPLDLPLTLRTKVNLEKNKDRQRLLPGKVSGAPDWVRLVFTLMVGDKLTGMWLFGSRDPDDAYPSDDVEVLSVLAEQTALALVNIDQSEALHALYQVDVERHDAERLHLAAELHDDVLNQLGVLGSNLALINNAGSLQQPYQDTITHIRQIINGLRPAMLAYGLYRGLEVLNDDLQDRLPENGPEIKFEITPTDVRYDARVEMNLFRMVQQSCQNALQHARCTQVVIRGTLEAGTVRLEVVDDGMGFPAGEQLDLQELLVNGHFGLAGMVERSRLIGAEMTINTAPNSGSCIQINWSSDRNLTG